MARLRVKRILVPAAGFAALLVAGFLAVRFLVDTLLSQGVGPATLFAFLMLVMVVALLWRGTLNMRRALRRLRT